jgi:hypothetical protein
VSQCDGNLNVHSTVTGPVRFEHAHSLITRLAHAATTSSVTEALTATAS